MPLRRLGSGIGSGRRGEMVGLGDRADGIDGAAHGQGATCGVGQSEIHGTAGAVGRRGGRIKTGLGPEAGHRLYHRLQGRVCGAGRFQAAGPAFPGNAVLHHEPLHRHRPPGVEDRQAPALPSRRQGAIGR